MEVKETCLKCLEAVFDRELCATHFAIASAMVGKTLSWTTLEAMGQAGPKRTGTLFICKASPCVGAMHYAKGYCYRHYVRAKRQGKPEQTNPIICVEPGCNNKAWLKGYVEGRLLCYEHANEAAKYGKLIDIIGKTTS